MFGEMDKNSRSPGNSGNPDFPASRPIAKIVEQIVREGHGRTTEQRQICVAWKPEHLAAKAGLNRTTIPKWLKGSLPRESSLRNLTKAAFGTETSDHPLARELWAAYRALKENSTPSADPDFALDAAIDHVVQLDDRTPLASGQFYIPLPGQRGGNPERAPIHLRLVFPGLAKVTTRKGSVVFAVTSARLSVGASAGSIVDHNPDFETGWAGEWTSVRPIPSVGREVAYQISSNDLTRPLFGNVLVRQGEDPHVRLFDIEIEVPEIKVRIHGRVTFDVDGVMVDLQRSRLKEPVSAEQRAQSRSCRPRSRHA
jgi:hypothetical protein